MLNLQRLAVEDDSSSSQSEESICINVKRFYRKCNLLDKYSKKVKDTPAEFAPMEPSSKICGVYDRDTVVERTKIIKFTDMYNFYFYKEVLTEEQYKIMLDTRDIRYKNKHQVYLSNPYHADIGTRKLYIEGDFVRRCQIIDLYCERDASRLRLRAVIKLVDRPYQERAVDYRCIFDYPQMIRYYQFIEPEVKQARLFLGPKIPEDLDDTEVKKYAMKLLKPLIESQSSVRILDFKKDVYYVDILDERQKSIVSQILEKFGGTKLRPFLIAPPLPRPAEDVFFEVITTQRSVEQAGKLAQGASSRKAMYRGGALLFFKNLSAKYHEEFKDLRAKQGFFQVLVIDWGSPNHLTIQPAAEDYYKYHKEFVASIQNLNCIKRAERVYYKEHKPYQVGEYIIYKNFSSDTDLGGWLRGVVVSVSCYDEHSLVTSNLTTDAMQNYEVVTKLLDKNMIELDDLLYLVRSVDYGYHTRCSHLNMRHLEDMREIRSIGTWTLRCRLFGVGLSTLDRQVEWLNSNYSKSCSDVIDSWIRERLLDRGRLAAFHVLMRSELNNYRTYDKLYDITLFHRHEPRLPIKYSVRPFKRRTRYDCLNWHLVECGVASDAMDLEEETPSHIMLDDYIVNMLVRHDMI